MNRAPRAQPTSLHFGEGDDARAMIAIAAELVDRGCSPELALEIVR
jgi:hypothetical protein